MTVAELRAKLSLIEAEESMYAGMTPSDVSALEQLLADSEDWMAARAVFALSRIGSHEAIAVLARMVTDRRQQVRLAVAAAVGQRPIVLPDPAVISLLRDEDAGVRQFATFAVKPENGREARSLLSRLASHDAMSFVKENAMEALRKLR